MRLKETRKDLGKTLARRHRIKCLQPKLRLAHPLPPPSPSPHVLPPSERKKSLQTSNHLSSLLSFQLTAPRRLRRFNLHISLSVALRASPEKPIPIPWSWAATTHHARTRSATYDCPASTTRAQIVRGPSHRAIEYSPYMRHRSPSSTTTETPCRTSYVGVAEGGRPVEARGCLRAPLIPI